MISSFIIDRQVGFSTTFSPIDKKPAFLRDYWLSIYFEIVILLPRLLHWLPPRFLYFFHATFSHFFLVFLHCIRFSAFLASSFSHYSFVSCRPADSHAIFQSFSYQLSAAAIYVFAFRFQLLQALNSHGYWLFHLRFRLYFIFFICFLFWYCAPCRLSFLRLLIAFNTEWSLTFSYIIYFRL